MPYSINEQLFDTWNEASLYILGYLWADGSIYRGDQRDRYEITISSTRMETLETLKEYLQSEHPIKTISEGSAQLNIGSKAIVERLEALGLTDCKVQTLRYPPIPVELERHFIRGYFDGKGSFMIEQGRRIVTNISGGCLVFIEQLRDKLVEHGLGRAEIHQYGEGRSSNALRYYVRDTRRLCNLMYTDAEIYSREQKARYDRGWGQNEDVH